MVVVRVLRLVVVGVHCVGFGFHILVCVVVVGAVFCIGTLVVCFFL